MDILAVLAEEKIREAMRRGEFANLAGKGQPLQVDELSHVPEELRAGYIILKNAGVLPEEMQLKKEMVSLQRLIDCCYEEEQKTGLKKKLTEKMLRFNMLMEKRKMNNSAFQFYREKIYSRLGF
ncbi:DnaJ family domain-containing protein [Desulfofundulus thermosubterraneus]|uniref:DnaJ family domain-containing protein n=1 Tax=Desulfofundulus thermosubterraneus TaxID=348840 RepID=UPI000932C23F|nr:DnaJ family domain-containing protein [Desulfofundulus thermosubterraneus]